MGFKRTVGLAAILLFCSPPKFSQLPKVQEPPLSAIVSSRSSRAGDLFVASVSLDSLTSVAISVDTYLEPEHKERVRLPTLVNGDEAYALFTADVRSPSDTLRVYVSGTYPNGDTANVTIPIALKARNRRTSVLPPNIPRAEPHSNRDRLAILRAHQEFASSYDNTVRGDFLDGYASPVAHCDSTSFGSRRMLNGEEKQMHEGADCSAPLGTKVRAALDGVVTLADSGFFYEGTGVVLSHGLGLHTRYMHSSALLVHRGERVRAGELIARVGEEGRATGPHLHYEAVLVMNGKPVHLDPLSLSILDNYKTH